jgi:hypothetical protein
MNLFYTIDPLIIPYKLSDYLDNSSISKLSQTNKEMNVLLEKNIKVRKANSVQRHRHDAIKRYEKNIKLSILRRARHIATLRTTIHRVVIVAGRLSV